MANTSHDRRAHLYISEQQCPDVSYSDELEALHTQELELKALRNSQGVVIQHRSWRAGEAFRSDDIRDFGTGCILVKPSRSDGTQIYHRVSHSRTETSSRVT